MFQGTLMGSPKFIEKPIGMVRLWSHELKRVFEDRLTTPVTPSTRFINQLTEITSSKVGMKWSDIVRADSRVVRQLTDVLNLASGADSAWK